MYIINSCSDNTYPFGASTSFKEYCPATKLLITTLAVFSFVSITVSPVPSVVAVYSPSAVLVTKTFSPVLV